MSIFLTEKIGSNKLTAKAVLTDPVLFLAFGFGSGLVKKAPGTMGTLAALPVYGLFALAGNQFFIALTLFTVIAGIWICDAAAKKLGEHDFGGIVWDEVAGFLVTMCWAPFSWPALIVGFVLFRLFDIIKPWPIIWADRKISGGLGIMLDDILAGIMSGLILLIIADLGWL